MVKGVSNSLVRNFLAEFLGTFALVLFGDGAVAQSALGGSNYGGFLSICFGYGLALMIGILISGGVSGGHLNPAVTLTMAMLGKLKPIEIPGYMLGQFLGAFFAALCVWGNYADMIRITEGNDDSYSMVTAGIFASYPNTSELSTATLAMDQILGSAMLLVIILAVTDSRNMKVTSGLVPLLIGLGLTAIHLSFGLNAGAAINPARDFSPRLLSFIAGWPKETFEAFDYWFWIPLLMPFIGGPLGGLMYTACISLHHQDE